MKRLAYLSTLGTAVFVSLMLLAATSARAQDQDEEQPDTGVARVSLIRGDVVMMRGDSGDQVAATINMPLVRGDKVMTGDKSQAEIQLDHANIIRLAPGTEVRIADLTRSLIQLQVAHGLVNYTVSGSNEADIEIDTPNMAVRPIKEGSYRIQVNSPTDTQLIVRKGDADVTTPQGTARVEEGRIIIVRGAETPEYQIAKAPGRDDWDKWNNERDKAILNAKSYQYTNRYYTGAQDLDRHGRWVYVPDYGDWAWTPYVGAGWSPYHYGYWGWQPYWGWTWTSYEPWGWAPYHYGRWFYWGSSWYWWPGRHHYGYRPLWGPAWVSFVGFGFGHHNWHFGFGYGYNSIGWLALGPYDHCYRWWGRHNTYNAVNITNITNITNVTNIDRGGGGRGRFAREGYQSNLQAALTNSNIRGAVTRVSTTDFARGNFSRGQRGLDANTLRGGQLVQGRVPAAPTREALRPVANNSRIARTSGAESFFSQRQPPAVNRTFNEQAASVQTMMRTHNPFGAANSRQQVATGAAATAGPRGSEAAGRSAAVGLGAGGRGTQSSAAPNTSSNRGRENVAGRSATTPGQASPRSGATNRVDGSTSGSANVTSRGADQGWQRFGQAGRSEVGVAAGSRGQAEIAQRNARGSQSPAEQPSTARQQDGNWRRFGSGESRAAPGRPTTGGDSPSGRAAPGRTNQRGTGNVSGADRQPQTQGARGAGAAPVRIEGGSTPPQQGAASGSSTTGGWRRFGSQLNRSGGERPALSIRKPITTQRAAPRSFERSQPASPNRAGQGSSPSPAAPRSLDRSGRAAPRNFERDSGGAQRGNTGRAAPSSAPRNFVGGSTRGSSAPSRSLSGGASRGWSGPSGGAVRSAPSRSNGGGGSRGWSAPSRGGGGRSVSTPSGGGGRSASAPSGGGRSAPSGSRGGGGRGRR